MTHPGNGCHVAQWPEKDREGCGAMRDVLRDGERLALWSGRSPSVLAIIDNRGNILETYYPGKPMGDRPSAMVLLDTGWMAYPGTEWREEPPGWWSRAVLPARCPRRDL